MAFWRPNRYGSGRYGTPKGVPYAYQPESSPVRGGARPSVPTRGILRVTWARLTSLEPRLLVLLDEARQPDPGGRRFCANLRWYRLLKPALVNMIGWDAWTSQAAELKTREAYDLAYDTLYDALPPCRDCGCG